jgi:lysophospholipase L1-like esterase
MKPDQAARYEAWLERELAAAHPREIDAYAETAFRHYADVFRSLGATPIFFVTPGSETVLPSKFRSAPSETVMSFNDAQRYPSLYQAAVRLDEGHLNAKGADEFSRLLAARFLETEHAPGK